MKIYIVGSVGSGKTTLARQLAEHYNIPHFETDNFVWTRHPSGDIRNSVDKRDKLLNYAIELDQWIIEGVHMDWTDEALEASDYILFLDVPVSIRHWRIIKRYTRQMLRLEKANYTPTFSIFIKMFRWNSYFEKQMKPEFQKKFSAYDKKVVQLSTSDLLKIKTILESIT